MAKSPDKRGYKPDDTFSDAVREGLKAKQGEGRPYNPEETHKLVADFKKGKSASDAFQFDLEKDKRNQGKKKI